MEKPEKVVYSVHPTLMLYPPNPIEECKKDEKCAKLAEAGYYEARGESDLGVLLVLQSVENRVAHRRWGRDVFSVINEPYQYSYIHDGSLKRAKREPEQWDRVYLLAYRFLHGAVEVPEEFKLVTHYHDKSIRNPWGFKKVVQVGSFTGYQCTGYC